jgi:predicted nucleic acid-binding protein
MESPTTENQPSRDSPVSPVSFLVDTDICSAYMKGDHYVLQRLMPYRGQLHVSAVAVGELFTWALRATASPKRLPGSVSVSLTESQKIIIDINAYVLLSSTSRRVLRLQSRTRISLTPNT